MSTLSWLHISDLHQGMSLSGQLWPNVRHLFLQDLAAIHKSTGPWDIAFFTGDLTQSGTQFDALEPTLLQLWEKMSKLGSEPKLVCVPGNHDLKRPDAFSPAARSLMHFCDDEELREHFWEKKKSPYRDAIQKAFEGYEKWISTTQIPTLKPLFKGALPGDAHYEFNVETYLVKILGLNSAYLQLTKGNYHGKLHLDVRQLNDVCPNGDAPQALAGSALNILLTHHPVEWLGTRNHFVSEVAPPGRFDLHLFGHMHEGVYKSQSQGGTPFDNKLQAYSLFGLSEFDGPQGRPGERLHGYVSGQFQFENTGAVRMRIWPRTLSKSLLGHWQFTPDTRSFALESDNGTRSLIVREPRV